MTIYFNNQNELLPLFSLNNETKYSFLLTNEYSELNVINNSPITEQSYISINNISPYDNLCYESINLKEEIEENKNVSKDKTINFVVKKEMTEPIIKTLNKRGRKKNKNIINGKEKTHGKNSPDNLLRKIQVHYLTFIISFINEILQKLGIKQKFLHLNHKFKRNVNRKFVEYLKTKNIRQIICNEISPKYKEKEDNELIYDKIEVEVLKKILSENYLTFFRKIYYNKSNNINLKEYGLDKNIILSKKVKKFNDLQKKIDSKNGYKIDINQFIEKHFFTSKFNLRHYKNYYI